MDEEGNEKQGSTDSGDWEEAEPRDAGRVHITSSVDVKDVAHLVTGAGMDVSVGGLYLVVDHMLPVRTLVHLKFAIDEVDHSFSVRGIVQWRQQQPVGEEDRYGLGIEFLNLGPEDRSALESYVERYEPIEPDEETSNRGSDRPSPGGDEPRRSSGRVPMASNVTLMTVANLTKGLGSDLSADGIYLLTSEKYEVGRTIDLEFTLSGVDRIFDVLGEVKWRRSHPVGDIERYGHGVEFANLDADDRRLLEQFVQHREPIEPVKRFDDVDDTP